jgi:flagellar hook protein FlgE
VARDDRRMSPVSSIALGGVHSALQRFSAAAGGIANMHAPDADLVSETLNLVTAKHEFSANLAVLRTEADMLDRLLDIRV